MTINATTIIESRATESIKLAIKQLEDSVAKATEVAVKYPGNFDLARDLEFAVNVLQTQNTNITRLGQSIRWLAPYISN